MANNHTTAATTNALHRESPPQVVVMVPLPAHGHLNQLLHLSRLISAHNIPVFYAAAATHISQVKLRVHGGWDPSSAANLRFQSFPATHFDNPLPDPNATNKFPSHLMPSLAASKDLRRPVFDFVDELSKIFRRVVVIYDSLMSYVVQDIDSIHNADCYCFRSISAFSICSFEAAADSPIPPEMLGEIPSLDGHYPPEFSEFLVLQSETKKIFSGEIYNSCQEIEGPYLDFLAKFNRNGSPKVWGIGPFHPVSSIPEKALVTGISRHQCLSWLDKQRPKSVILVSFGTTSCFPDRQMEEIAVGLERSQHKFVWVVREADKGDIFSGKVRKARVPDGFATRIRGRGLLVTDWAPQLEILGHPSTGGFMSHCGWNSCLESISMGVPMAVWPLHSDQPANAVLVTKVLRIGVEVMKWSRRNELVMAERVEEVVRMLMGSEEGGEVRKRAAELGGVVRSSVEGGAVRKEMDAFINHICR